MTPNGERGEYKPRARIGGPRQNYSAVGTAQPYTRDENVGDGTAFARLRGGSLQQEENKHAQNKGRHRRSAQPACLVASAASGNNPNAMIQVRR
jgi:hypothetical protein